MTRTGAAGPRSGPFLDQPPTEGCANYRFTWSALVQLLYHQQTKNMLFFILPLAPLTDRANGACHDEHPPLVDFRQGVGSSGRLSCRRRPNRSPGRDSSGGP